ncbi:MAG: hypothetical protein ACR2JF_16190 [Iamia sp.]
MFAALAGLGLVMVGRAHQARRTARDGGRSHLILRRVKAGTTVPGGAA